MRLLRDPGQSDVEHRLERLDRAQIVIFAAREALRAAPLLAIAGPEEVDRFATPCFRSILTACVSAFGDGRDDLAAPAADAAYAAANRAFAVATESGAVHSAAYAAARTGTAAVAPYASAAAYAGFGAAYCSARAAAARNLMLDEAMHDLMRLEGAFSAEQLRAAPLWPFGAPAEFREAVDRLALAMAHSPAQPAVWIDWYAAKIGGWPVIRPYEIEWAATPETIWNGEPTVLARTLSEIRERHIAAGDRDDFGRSA